MFGLKKPKTVEAKAPVTWWRQNIRRERLMWAEYIGKRLGTTRSEAVDLLLMDALERCQDRIQIVGSTEALRELAISRIEAQAVIPGEVSKRVRDVEAEARLKALRR